MSASKMMVAWLKRHPFAYRFARYQIYSRIQSFDRRNVFVNVYRNNLWDGKESSSGTGSSLEATEALRAVLPGVIAELEIKSLLDIPCGDFNWMRSLSLPLERYIGADLVARLIEKNKHLYFDSGDFICLDLLKTPLPRVDAVFCRDCLPHLSLRDVRSALRNIARATPRYLMMTNYPYCSKNVDTVAPYYRPLNFEIAPFNFVKPLFMAQESSVNQRDEHSKYLGVWRSADISV